MSAEFRLPALRGAQSATIDRWLKKTGDSVAAGEKLLEAHSDQFDWDIPSPSQGILAEIRAEVGASVREGDVLAVLAGAEDAQSASTVPASSGAAPATQNVTANISVARNGAAAARPEASPRVTPVAAAMAAEHQIDLVSLIGTGIGGQVTKEDVLAAIRQRETAPSTQATVLSQPAALTHPLPALMPKAIRDIPQASLFIGADLANVASRRDALQTAWQRREGFELDYLPFLVLAVASALRHHAELNSVFTDSGITMRRSIELSLAPATHGSPVSIIRGAELLNLVGIARRVQSARSGVTVDTARGMFAICDRRAGGATLSTAIIPAGHSALLTIGAIQPRVVAEGDGLAIHLIAYLGLTYDQRLIDDFTADLFMALLQQQLETGAVR